MPKGLVTRRRTLVGCVSGEEGTVALVRRRKAARVMVRTCYGTLRSSVGDTLRGAVVSRVAFFRRTPSIAYGWKPAKSMNEGIIGPPPPPAAFAAAAAACSISGFRSCKDGR